MMLNVYSQCALMMSLDPESPREVCVVFGVMSKESVRCPLFGSNDHGLGRHADKKWPVLNTISPLHPGRRTGTAAPEPMIH